MDVQEEIYQAIDNMVERRLDKQSLSLQKEGIVVEVSARGDKKYKVLVNGVKYAVRDGIGLKPQLNSSVWVCVPNNDWAKAYICAGKNLQIDPDDPSVGTHVVGNPTGPATDTLRKVKIADDIYGIPVTDVRVNGSSVVASTIANVSVPVTDVQVDGTSVMDGTIAKITSGGGGSTVTVTPLLSTGTQIATIGVDGTDYDLYAPNGGGTGDVADVYVNGVSVLDSDKIAQIDLTDYATDTELATAVATLQASFQAGVDSVYNACVTKGSTPASHSLSDVVQGIIDIPSSGGGSNIISIYSYQQTGRTLSDSLTYTCYYSGTLIVALCGYVDSLSFSINGTSYSPFSPGGSYQYSINDSYPVRPGDVIEMSWSGSGTTGMDGNIYLITNGEAIVNVESTMSMNMRYFGHAEEV